MEDCEMGIEAERSYEEQKRRQSEYIKKTKGAPEEQKEIGRIEKNEYCDIVIIKDKFQGKEGVTIREYLKMPSYTGFTKKGLRIPMEKFDKLMDILGALHQSRMEFANSRFKDSAARTGGLKDE